MALPSAETLPKYIHTPGCLRKKLVLKAGVNLDNINGIIIINKEPGFTSHDVVNVIRRIYGTRKVGHTGTLDPDATGVLPICIGKATKVADMLTASDKCYVAGVRLGLTTDTQDISGQVLTRSEVNISPDALRQAVEHFTGQIEQIPPMYSALKVNGKKLCDLARQGIEVERKAREISIFSSEMSDFDGTDFNLSVHCSKGTYIRTLCHDIGTFLGCGAVMASLQRTKSSVFTLENSYSLDILKAMDETSLRAALMPIDSVFDTYPRFDINDVLKKKLCNGAPCYAAMAEGTYRVYDSRGTFLCIARAEGTEAKKLLKSVKTFY